MIMQNVLHLSEMVLEVQICTCPFFVCSRIASQQKFLLLIIQKLKGRRLRLFLLMLRKTRRRRKVGREKRPLAPHTSTAQPPAIAPPTAARDCSRHRHHPSQNLHPSASERGTWIVYVETVTESRRDCEEEIEREILILVV
jgi:hypothetical protein